MTDIDEAVKRLNIICFNQISEEVNKNIRKDTDLVEILISMAESWYFDEIQKNIKFKNVIYTSTFLSTIIIIHNKNDKKVLFLEKDAKFKEYLKEEYYNI